MRPPIFRSHTSDLGRGPGACPRALACRGRCPYPKRRPGLQAGPKRVTCVQARMSQPLASPFGVDVPFVGQARGREPRPSTPSDSPAAGDAETARSAVRKATACPVLNGLHHRSYRIQISIGTRARQIHSPSAACSSSKFRQADDFGRNFCSASRLTVTDVASPEGRCRRGPTPRQAAYSWRP